MKIPGCLLLKLIIGTLLVLIGGPIWSQNGVTTVSGNVYGRDGSAAQGSVRITWPGFSTAARRSIHSGALTARLGPDGMLTVKLAPNVGAFPVDACYTASYHLADGSTRHERWRVPDTQKADLSAVRVMPGARAKPEGVDASSGNRSSAPRDASGTSFLLLSGGTLSGPLQLGGDPVSSLQAATKNYVDTSVATLVPLTGGSVSGTLRAANLLAKLPRIDLRDADFAGGADPTGIRDSLAAITAAIAFARVKNTPNEATYPTLYLPPGHYKVNGTIRLPNNLHLVGDSKANTIVQETNPTANLFTIYDAHYCSVYTCYGGIENVTLEGTGKATTGTLLETDAGTLIFRDVQFYNNAGRGLQMNGPSERTTAHNLSFFDVRWPMVLAGDTNEDYFYNTHVVEAGQTKDNSGSPTWFSNWCYSINCTNGVFHAPGTQASPTILYPDPHGSIHIDKAVNVSFIGGSIKSTGVMSGVHVWNGDLVKFENMYHEDVYGGNIPRTNRAYILGGKAEQTYFTGTLAGSGSTVAVHDASWMPQYFGNPADVSASSGDFYGYVILPQDYNRASTAPSAYVPGVRQNQFELVNIAGFASDGNLYIAGNGRSLIGSTAPAGTQWPAGSVIEQFSGVYGFNGPVNFNNIHMNQIQGPTAVGGYKVGCDQTNVWTCGEMVIGYAPDIESPTSNPATNQVGLYAPLGDVNDPLPGAGISVSLRAMDMGHNSGNPYVGQIATHHMVTMQIYGKVFPEAVESTAAVTGTSAGKQLSIAGATGGSYITAPLYATGEVASTQVTLPDAGTTWDTARGIFTKNTSIFGRYQQYSAYMSGLQYQNQYCLFDTPVADGGHVANRFCAGGGPTNTSPGGAGYGQGIEYDSWNGSAWVSIFRVYGANGAGIVSTGPLTSTTLASSGSVTGAKVTFSGSGSSLSNAPVLVWSPWGACSVATLGCTESGAPLNLIYPATIRAWTLTTTNMPTGCTNPGVVTLHNGSTVIATIRLANGIGTYTGAIAAPLIPANSALGIAVSSAATGCSVFGNGFNSNITYTMQ